MLKALGKLAVEAAKVVGPELAPHVIDFVKALVKRDEDAVHLATARAVAKMNRLTTRELAKSALRKAHGK